MTDDEREQDKKLHNSDKKLHNRDQREDQEEPKGSEQTDNQTDNSKSQEGPAAHRSGSEVVLPERSAELLHSLREFSRVLSPSTYMRKMQEVVDYYAGGHEQPPSGVDSDKLLIFKKDDLDQYVAHRKKGLAPKSIDWIERSSKALWESTNGEISQRSMISLRENVLNNYKSADSHSKLLGFAAAFLKFLAQTKIEPKYTSFTIYLELPRSVKEKKRVTSRIVTKKDIANVIAYIRDAEKNRKISSYRAQNYAAFVLFGAYTGQRSMATMAKLTVGQFREALAREKPVMHVTAQQDKVRMAHFVPIHPRLVPFLQPLLEGRMTMSRCSFIPHFGCGQKGKKSPCRSLKGIFS